MSVGTNHTFDTFTFS